MKRPEKTLEERRSSLDAEIDSLTSILEDLESSSPYKPRGTQVSLGLRFTLWQEPEENSQQPAQNSQEAPRWLLNIHIYSYYRGIFTKVIEKKTDCLWIGNPIFDWKTAYVYYRSSEFRQTWESITTWLVCGENQMQGGSCSFLTMSACLTETWATISHHHRSGQAAFWSKQEFYLPLA